MLTWFMNDEQRYEYFCAKARRYESEAEEAFLEWNKSEIYCPNCKVGMYRYAKENDAFDKNFGASIPDQPNHEIINCPRCKHVSIWMFGSPAPLLMRHYNPMCEQQMKLVNDIREQVKAILGNDLPADRAIRLADRITDAIAKTEKVATPS